MNGLLCEQKCKVLLLLFLFNLCIYLAAGFLDVAHEILDFHCGMQNLFFLAVAYEFLGAACGI